MPNVRFAVRKVHHREGGAREEMIPRRTSLLCAPIAIEPFTPDADSLAMIGGDVIVFQSVEATDSAVTALQSGWPLPSTQVQFRPMFRRISAGDNRATASKIESRTGRVADPCHCWPIMLTPSLRNNVRYFSSGPVPTIRHWHPLSRHRSSRYSESTT